MFFFICLTGQPHFDLTDIAMEIDGEAKAEQAGEQVGRTRQEHNAVAAMTSPWIEKYRPETLQDLIAHQDIVETGEKFPAISARRHALRYGSSFNLCQTPARVPTTAA